MAFNNYSEDDLFMLGMSITGGKSQLGGKTNKQFNSSNTTSSSTSSTSSSSQNLTNEDELHPVSVSMTDREYYMLVSGMIAGLRIGRKQNRTQKILDPINIGTPATIGISVANEVYVEGQSEYRIPVYTHSVNIGYNGFTALIEYDKQLLNYKRIEEGEFGPIAHNITDNKIYVQGINNEVEFNSELILFYIVFSVKQVLTKETPANINIISSPSDTDQSKTTLLTYREDNTNNKSLYYITPLHNISGKISSNLEKKVSTVGSKEEIKTKASPSGIYLTSSYTPPGRIGYISVITAGNKEKNNLYNSFKVNIEVNNTNESIELIAVKPMEGWEVTYTITNSAEDVYMIDIEGVRGKSDSDTCTACYIEFKANENQSEYNVPFINVYSELSDSINANTYQDINRKDGLAYYSENISPSDAVGKTSSNCSSVTVSGSIYSPVDQTIWLRFDSSPSIPVFIPASTPDNPYYILVDIPIIKSEDEGKEASLEITTEKGYILIPAGFEIIINNSDLADELYVDIFRVSKETIRCLDGYILTLEETKTGDIFIVCHHSYKLRDKIKYKTYTSTPIIISGKELIKVFNREEMKLIESTPHKKHQTNSIKASFGIKVRLE